MSNSEYHVSINGQSHGPMDIRAIWETLSKHFSTVRRDDMQAIEISCPMSGARWPIVGRRIYWEALASDFEKFLRYLGAE